MKKDIILTAEEYIIIMNEIWLFSRELNILFTINMDDGKKCIRASIPEESFGAYRLSTKILHRDGVLYLLPWNAKEMWAYHINRNEWEKIVVDSPIYRNMKYKYARGILYQGQIILIGCVIPYIVVYDIEEAKSINIEIPLVENKGDLLQGLLFRSPLLEINESLYLASCRTNNIYVFNLETRTIRTVSVGKSNWAFSGISYDGTHFWISPRGNSPLIKWDGHKCVEYVNLPNVECREGYYSIVADSNNIILAHSHNGQLINISNDSNQRIEEYSDFLVFIDNKVKIRKRGEIEVKNDIGESRVFDIHFEIEDVRNYMKRNEIGRVQFEENRYFSLKDYIRL